MKQWQPIPDGNHAWFAIENNGRTIRQNLSYVNTPSGIIRLCELVEVDDSPLLIPTEIAETLLEAIENHRRLWGITHGSAPDDVRDRAIAVLEWIKEQLTEEQLKGG